MEKRGKQSSHRSGKSRTLKTLLIDPFKQIKFGLYVLGLTIGFLVASAYVFVRSFIEQYDHVMKIFEIVDPDLQMEMITSDVFRQNSQNLILLFVLFLSVMLTLIFRMTHRYYGPLVAIEKFAEKIQNGRYHVRIKLRNKDELQQLANKLNQMAAALEEKHGSIVDESGAKIERRQRNQNDSDHDSLDDDDDDDERLQIRPVS